MSVISGTAFRTLLHFSIPVWLIYYFLEWKTFNPLPVIWGIVVIVWSLEILRLKKKVFIFGMREYEKKRVASYAWGAVGVAVTLSLLPFELAVPVLFAGGFVDPVCRISRSMKISHSMKTTKFCYHYPLFPILLAYFIYIAAGILFGNSDPVSILIMLSAPLVTVISEYPRYVSLDDDMLILGVPAVYIYIVSYLSCLVGL